jgi:short-subunit dehydrogenase
MIKAVLECIGGAASLLVLYASASFLFALSQSADTKTALTPKLPPDAYEGQVVFITGASSGIGKEIALLLSQRGACLILSSRTRQDLEQVAQECRNINPKIKIKVLPLDLNDTKSLKSKAEEAIQAFGTINVLINNGGISTRVFARDVSSQSDDLLCHVDYLSHVFLTKAVAPVLEQSEEARIINTLSVCSKVGIPARTAYCGAKFALLGWMDAFRIECHLRGHSTIHILNACIGSTNTPLPSRAVVGIKSDGSVETYGEEDVNLKKGLSPSFVAERLLSVSFHKSVDESWLAKGNELLILYMKQYAPLVASKLIKTSIGRKYAIEKSSKCRDE